MNIFEQTLLDLGASWTISKLLPYILFALVGTFIVWIISKKLFSKTWQKVAFSLIGACVGFFSYFAFEPIYQGDFSNNGTPIVLTSELKLNSSKELVVITIPGCPFCAESVERMKVLKKYNPSLKITYVVCSKLKENMTPYKQLIGNEFKVQLAQNPEYFAKISKGSFPSFLLIDGNSSIHWSNQSFGVRAVDYVNANF